MPDKKEDWEIIMTEQAQKDTESNPEAAAMVRELSSRLRQVMAEVDAGRIGSVEEALESIGMTRVSNEEVEALMESGKIGPPPRDPSLGVRRSFTPAKALDIAKEFFDLCHAKDLTGPEVFLLATLLVAISGKTAGMKPETLANAVMGAADVIESMLDAVRARGMGQKKES